MAYSPGGDLLAEAHAFSGSISIWDAATGALLTTLTGHSEEVDSLAFSPGGKLLASSSKDNTVRVWGVR